MIFLFIDFYFQNGQLIAASSGFNFWSLFNVIVGSLIGFIGAFYIFSRTTQSTKKREEDARQQSLTDKSNYFKFLLREAPGIIKKQANNYDKFVTIIRQDKLSIHIPAMVLYTPISRLLEVNQNEFFFHAYINQYPVDKRQDAIKEFGNIYSRLDYYYEILQQSLESLKIFRTRKREAMQIFTNKVKDVEDYAASLLLNQNLQISHVAYLQSVNRLFQTYIPQKANNNTNFHFFWNTFLVPLFQFTNAIGNPPTPIHSLGLLLREARIAYTHIEYHSDDEANEFEEYSKALKDKLNEFEEMISKVQ